MVQGGSHEDADNNGNRVKRKETDAETEKTIAGPNLDQSGTSGIHLWLEDHFGNWMSSSSRIKIDGFGIRFQDFSLSLPVNSLVSWVTLSWMDRREEARGLQGCQKCTHVSHMR